MLEKGNKRIINSWAMYDWANSVYSLVITATIFPIYFVQVTRISDNQVVSFFGIEFINTVLYAYAVAFSFLIVAFVLPLLSSIADYTGKKKKFMQFFAYLGALSCMGLFFFDGSNVEFGIITFILAGIGYAGSIVFYNAFLPEICEPKDHDRVSAKGYALGYAGSIILLLFNMVMIMKPELFGITDELLPAKISFLTVGVWWAGFAQITFRALPDNVYDRKYSGQILFNGYRALKKVFDQVMQSRRLKTFLPAFFFYTMGLLTVLYLAATYGQKGLGLGADILIPTIMIIQIVGIAGAWLFSNLSNKIGNIRALSIAILIWIGICIGAYFIKGATGFVIVAFWVGLVMGGGAIPFPLNVFKNVTRNIRSCLLF